LVAITPGAGFVGSLAAILIGLVGGALCYFAVLMKARLGYDDALDVVGVHGVGGLWGALATGLFASLAWNPDGANGLFYGNANQFVIQAIGAGAAIAYSVVLTYIILKVVDAIIDLRAELEDEIQGLDVTDHKEVGYSL
jgi:Amt family ammonium transporter